MLIVKLWHYIRGYVIINLKGNHLERLINLIHYNNILMWDIIKKNNSELTAKIELKDYETTNKLAQRLSCNVELVMKKGLTLWKWQLKSRKFFAIALCLVLLVVFTISSLVLTVDIKEIDSMESSEIIIELQDLGLKPWVFKRTLDLDMIKLTFLKNHGNIEFMNIDFEGTKAIIDLVEQDQQGEIYDKDTPVDLIAAKDGVIKQILVIHGTANIEIDKTVKKGDLLVKGENIINLGEEDIRKEYVHAMAKILAETQYDKTYEIRKYSVLDDTKFKINRVLQIGDVVINFFEEGEDKYYYGGSEEKQYNFFGIEIPIKINKITYYEKENCELKSEDELINEVESKAIEEYRSHGNVEKVIIQSLREENNTIMYNVKITVIENIVEEQMIGGIKD